MNAQIETFADLIAEQLGEPEPGWWSARRADSEVLRQEAIGYGADADADAAWFLGTVTEARGGMAKAFEEMRAGDFRSAWNRLERVEIATSNLVDNPVLDTIRFEVEELAAAVAQWQGLFPYRLFASPELLIKREECSICGQTLDAWKSCGHETGRLYSGRLAHRVVREMEMLGASIVTDPVHKFSVLIGNEQASDYVKVRFVAERLTNPFAPWRIEEVTALHDHAMFKDSVPEAPCPCGAGASYATCCLPRPGVRLPHFQVLFDSPIPPDLPEFVLRPPHRPKPNEVEDRSSGE